VFLTDRFRPLLAEGRSRAAERPERTPCGTARDGEEDARKQASRCKRRAVLFAGPGGTQCAGLRAGRSGPRSEARRGKEISTGQRRHGRHVNGHDGGLSQVKQATFSLRVGTSPPHTASTSTNSNADRRTTPHDPHRLPPSRTTNRTTSSGRAWPARPTPPGPRRRCPETSRPEVA
jgi:hypothetical protein